MAKINLQKTVDVSTEDAGMFDAPVNVEANNVVPLVTGQSSEVQIFDDIPLPETVRSGGKAKYPWKALKPGQSFFTATPEGKTQEEQIKSFYTLCSTASKKHGCKFIARKWDGPNGAKGVMVWRTKD